MSVSSVSVKTKQKYKLILLGDQAVGKTSIIEKFVNDKFQQTQAPTVGIDFVVTNMQHHGKYYRLQLWDTAGQQRFKSLIPSYLRDSQCALIMYDVSNKQTFLNVQKWLQLYKQSAEQGTFVIIVGNKTDLKLRFPGYEEALLQLQKEGFQHFQVSAKSGHNVNAIFQRVVEIIQQKNNKPILDQKILQTIDLVGMGNSAKDVVSDGQTKLKLTINSQKSIDVMEQINNQKKKKRCC